MERGRKRISQVLPALENIAIFPGRGTKAEYFSSLSQARPGEALMLMQSFMSIVALQTPMPSYLYSASQHHAAVVKLCSCSPRRRVLTI